MGKLNINYKKVTEYFQRIAGRFPVTLVLIILTLEMSFASPGINSAWVILFASLALPSEYVGIFAVYKMLTTNYGSACSMLYSALEQIELSDAIGEMDKTYFKGEDSP